MRPETLNLEDQLAIFAEYKLICGLHGSALHMSLLSHGGNEIVGLGYNEVINSSFVLIDELKNKTVQYYDIPGEFENLGPTNSFQTLFQLRNPT